MSWCVSRETDKYCDKVQVQLYQSASSSENVILGSDLPEQTIEIPKQFEILALFVLFFYLMWVLNGGRALLYFIAYLWKKKIHHYFLNGRSQCALSLGHSNFRDVGPGSLVRTELGSEKQKRGNKTLTYQPPFYPLLPRDIFGDMEIVILSRSQRLRAC